MDPYYLLIHNQRSSALSWESADGIFQSEALMLQANYFVSTRKPILIKTQLLTSLVYCLVVLWIECILLRKDRKAVNIQETFLVFKDTVGTRKSDFHELLKGKFFFQFD